MTTPNERSKLCKHKGCHRDKHAAGYCQTHYLRNLHGRPMDAPTRRWTVCCVEGCGEEMYSAHQLPLCKRHSHRRGKKMDDVTKAERQVVNGGECSYDGCTSVARTSGLCPAHYRQKRLGIELRPIKVATGTYVNKQGYVLVYEPDRVDAPLDGWMMEHRKVMADYLGRPLLDNENVHHLNGKRDDNRLGNLELWVSSQPSGQRPQDLVKYAKEILKTYESEVPKHKKLRRRVRSVAA